MLLPACCQFLAVEANEEAAPYCDRFFKKALFKLLRSLGWDLLIQYCPKFLTKNYYLHIHKILAQSSSFKLLSYGKRGLLQNNMYYTLLV